MNLKPLSAHEFSWIRRYFEFIIRFWIVLNKKRRSPYIDSPFLNFLHEKNTPYTALIWCRNKNCLTI